MATPRLVVLLGDELIGEAPQLALDDGMGVLMGRFVPAPTYDTVSDVFLMYADGRTDEHFAERDALALSACVEPGGHILPAHTIHVIHYRSELEDGAAIDLVYSSEVLHRRARVFLGG